MALTGYLAGVLSDVMIQHGTSVTLTRKIMQVFFSSLCIIQTKIRTNLKLIIPFLFLFLFLFHLSGSLLNLLV